MATKKSFRNPRPDRPPEPFDLYYEIPVQEKVNVGTEKEPVWELQDIKDAAGSLVWEEKVQEFHANMNIRGGLMVDISPPDPDNPKAVARFGRAVREAMSTIVVEKDEFQKLLDDPRAVIQMSILSQIIQWAIEESGEVPTSGPSRS